MQKTPYVPSLSLLIEHFGNGQCIRVEFDDRVDRRSLFIQRLDPVQQVLHERYSTQLIALHSLAEFVDT